MGFGSGIVSFRRFNVVGPNVTVDEALINKVKENAIFAHEEIGLEEVSYGWIGPRHIMDGEISFENNVYGDALHLAIRVDTNKVPGDVRKAMIAQEEDVQAKSNP